VATCVFSFNLSKLLQVLTDCPLPPPSNYRNLQSDLLTPWHTDPSASIPCRKTGKTWRGDLVTTATARNTKIGGFPCPVNRKKDFKFAKIKIAAHLNSRMPPSIIICWHLNVTIRWITMIITAVKIYFHNVEELTCEENR